MEVKDGSFDYDKSSSYEVYYFTSFYCDDISDDSSDHDLHSWLGGKVDNVTSTTVAVKAHLMSLDVGGSNVYVYTGED